MPGLAMRQQVDMISGVSLPMHVVSTLSAMFV
jgi:hypothetical protein